MCIHVNRQTCISIYVCILDILGLDVCTDMATINFIVIYFYAIYTSISQLFAFIYWILWLNN